MADTIEIDVFDEISYYELRARATVFAIEMHGKDHNLDMDVMINYYIQYLPFKVDSWIINIEQNYVKINKSNGK